MRKEKNYPRIRRILNALCVCVALLATGVFLTPRAALAQFGTQISQAACAYMDCKVNTLAVGGATIGSNALAVTGTANVSGALTVGANSVLNTPLSVTLTNATGCPVGSCISGLGTGVATLLAGASNGTGGPAGTANPTFSGTANFSAISASGSITSTGGSVVISSASQTLQLRGGSTALSSPATGSFQLGYADNAAPVNYILRNNSGSGTNIAGASTTFIGSLGTGNAPSGDLIFQTGGAIAASGTTAATATTILTLKGVNQGVIWGGGTPTPTGTGTPSIAAGSTDIAGEVTAGATATSVVITFSATKTNAPFCVVTPQTQLVAFAYTISTSAITITQTATSGNKIDYHCFQH